MAKEGGTGGGGCTSVREQRQRPAQQHHTVARRGFLLLTSSSTVRAREHTQQETGARGPSLCPRATGGVMETRRRVTEEQVKEGWGAVKRGGGGTAGDCGGCLPARLSYLRDPRSRRRGREGKGREAPHGVPLELRRSRASFSPFISCVFWGALVCVRGPPAVRCLSGCAAPRLVRAVHACVSLHACAGPHPPFPLLQRRQRMTRVLPRSPHPSSPRPSRVHERARVGERKGGVRAREGSVGNRLCGIGGSSSTPVATRQGSNARVCVCLCAQQHVRHGETTTKRNRGGRRTHTKSEAYACAH